MTSTTAPAYLMDMDDFEKELEAFTRSNPQENMRSLATAKTTNTANTADTAPDASNNSSNVATPTLAKNPDVENESAASFAPPPLHSEQLAGAGSAQKSNAGKRKAVASRQKAATSAKKVVNKKGAGGNQRRRDANGNFYHASGTGAERQRRYTNNRQEFYNWFAVNFKIPIVKGRPGQSMNKDIIKFVTNLNRDRRLNEVALKAAIQLLTEKGVDAATRRKLGIVLGSERDEESDEGEDEEESGEESDDEESDGGDEGDAGDDGNDRVACTGGAGHGHGGPGL